MAETAAIAPLLTARFQQAFTLAGEVHGSQMRKGTQIPYLAHLMSVAALVLEYGGGEDGAIGGLLHDAVEDAADGTLIEHRIREQFGDHVAQIVLGCSDTVAVPGAPKPPGGTARPPTWSAWPPRTIRTCCWSRRATNSTTPGRSSWTCAPSPSP